MNGIRTIGKLLLIYIICFVVVDVIAALLVTILPSPGGRRLSGLPGYGSQLLFYVVWIVAGCFMGVLYTAGGKEATSHDQLIKKHPLIITVVALAFAILSVVLFLSLGQMQTFSYASNDFYYVPDNRYMTIAFFVSMLATSYFLTKMKI